MSRANAIMQTVSPTQQMKALLQKVGLPYKSIDCFGSQIIVTSHCRDTAERWANVLAKFATVRKAALKTMDDAKVNKGTVLRPTHVTVWRTYACIE